MIFDGKDGAAEMKGERDGHGSNDALASLQAEAGALEKAKHEAAEAAAKTMLNALMRLYGWRIQVGGRESARPAQTRDRQASRASTIRRRGENGGIDGGKV
jgi:hypothetical protein